MHWVNHWLKAIIIFAVFSLGGCGIHTTYLSSKPSIGGKGQPAFCHKIELHGLDLHIRPFNDIRTSQWTEISLIPIHITTKDVPRFKDKNLRVLIGYLPHEEGFSLDPKEITLHFKEADVKPVSITHWLKPDSRKGYRPYRPGKNVYCGAPPPPKPYYEFSSKPVNTALPETEKWHCYELTFDIPPPQPSQNFTISIDGMKKNGLKYDIPVISFEEDKWYDFEVAP